MKAIIVDDEYFMIKSFKRLTKDIDQFEIVNEFDDSREALEYIKDLNNRFDIAFLDIEMPLFTGIQLGEQIIKQRPGTLLVFLTAYDNYVKQANEIGADYYLMKPYKKETIESVIRRMKMLLPDDSKNIYLQMFGRFVVYKDKQPVPLVGKAKEILALIATRKGKEISNEEIYSTVWEDRTYSNEQMKVYYNALRRLKQALQANGIEDLLVSTARGQMINTAIVDCDYFAWRDGNMKDRDKFEGEFLSEYSWGESILSEILNIVNGWE